MDWAFWLGCVVFFLGSLMLCNAAAYYFEMYPPKKKATIDRLNARAVWREDEAGDA